MVAIGIDLGTTNSCVAVVKDGKPVVLLNDVSERTTPSVVSIIGKIISVGNAARARATQYPDKVIYGMKHIIGRKYDDPVVLENVNEFPFGVINKNNKSKVIIENDQYSPEEISGLLLKKLKDCAEVHLVEVADKAVITVPAYFTDSQRQATIDAGKLAGFQEVKLLDEPTAAAIAYGVDNSYQDGRTILVYDFGGGTFDVSIIKYQNNDYKVLAILGDLRLGGDNIDKALMKHFQSMLKDKNIEWNARKLTRLRKLCENAKISLAENKSTDVELYLLFDDKTDDQDFAEVELTVATLNKLNENIFNKTIDILDNCLTSNSWNISKDQIDSILLVGGSTRLTGVTERLKQYFGVEVKRNINPDEAVALGAAVVAAKWEGSAFNDLSFNMINAYSLGVRVKGDKMSVIIPRFKSIPVEQIKEYKTVPVGNPTAIINIYSGEKENVRENNFLGKFVVEGISEGPKGTMITVTFCIDENGVLRVTAIDQNGKSNHLDITLDKGNLTEAEIEELTEKIEIKIEASNEIIQQKIEQQNTETNDNSVHKFENENCRDQKEIAKKKPEIAAKSNSKNNGKLGTIELNTNEMRNRMFKELLDKASRK